MQVLRWGITAFSDLEPAGIRGGDGLSGLVPVLVVNSLWVPSVLSLCSLWPNTGNSSSIWKASEVKIVHFDVSWRQPAFCCLCVWKHIPCLEELPSELVGVRQGRRVSVLSYPPHPLPDFPVMLTVRPLFLILPSNLSRFFWVTFTPEQLGKRKSEKDVWENAPEQAITFDKAIAPVGVEEESQGVRALLVMKNAMKERACLWSRLVTTATYSRNDTAVAHQLFLSCCTRWMIQTLQTKQTFCCVTSMWKIKIKTRKDFDRTV